MVFEKIAGEILSRVLGNYLQGLSDNVSIGLWSGELSLQNVKIKKQIMQNLGFPVDISFGLVEELKLKIPWKNLTSSKIQITLKGLYLIANLLPQQNWTVESVADTLEKKKEEIKRYTEDLIKSLLEKKSSKGKDTQESKGFAQKLILKIIDNLQIKIQDIHVRVQSYEKYSFGATLESITLTTVNKDGKEQYIDRTKEEYKNEPLRKKLHLNNFGIYWDTNSKDLNDKKSLEKGIVANLNYMIHKGEEKPLDKNYILFVSFQANLWQLERGVQYVDPEYHFVISVQQFRVELENKQLQQLISLSELVKQFTEKRKPKLSMSLSSSSKSEAKMIQEFRQIFQNYYNTSHLSLQQSDRYQKIVKKVDLSQLLPVIKQVVKSAQRKKMLEQKSLKKTGWFTWSKQQLTQEQIQEVQSFLSDNLGTQSEVIKTIRPKQFFYIRVDLNAQEFEVSIGKSDNVIKRGINLQTTGFQFSFMKRQEGMKVELSMSDLFVNLFTQKGENIVRTPFYTKSVYFKDQKYVEATFQINPISSPYMDAELKVKVRPGVLLFNPLIISRIKQFTKIKVSETTEEKALEAYSSAKDKAAKSLEKQMQNTKLKIFNLDIEVSSPLIIIPFKAASKDECWAISTSSFKIFTDSNTLNPAIDKTSQIYRLKLQNVWMSSYRHLAEATSAAEGRPQFEGSELLVDNFNLQILLELEKKKNDISKPDIYLEMNIEKFDLSLCSNSFRNIKSIGNCFVEQKEPTLIVEDPIEMIKSQKKQILQNSEKKGIIHKRNPHSQFWNKYIAVLSGNYLYLYANKTDLSYDSFIYIKNTKLIDESREISGRDCSVRIQSKFSSQLLSFQNRRSLDEWRQIIESVKHQTIEIQQKQSSVSDNQQINKSSMIQKPNQILYMKLNLEFKVKIGNVNLKIYDSRQSFPWLIINSNQFNLSFKKYECYTLINVDLNSLSLIDQIESFRNQDLQYLFKPENNDLSKLMSVTVIQALPGDPRYKKIDNQILIHFGRVIFNWKPNSVHKLMRFFLTKEPNSPPLPKPQLKQSDQDLEIISSMGSMTHLDELIVPDRISLKLQVKIDDILIRMVNKNNKVMQGTINFQDFTLDLDIRPLSTKIKVNVQDLIINDSSNYPNTIICQEDYFPNIFTVFKTKQEEGKGIVDVQVSILNSVNEDGKDLLIHVTFHEIVIDLILEPFLRTIYFVIDQAIPSLSTSDPNAPKPPPTPRKLNAPVPSKTELIIKAIDSSILLKPTSKYEEVLSLEIPKLVLRNDSIWRQYTANSEKVMVSLYAINITDLKIVKDKQALTNNFTLDVNLEFINGSDFYYERFKDTFLGGTRIYISLSPIVLRLSNSHFRYIMKCINWNIGYSDNCTNILYPPEKVPEPVVEIDEYQIKPKQPSYPLYLNVSIKMLTLAVVDMLVPISNIALNLVELDFVNGDGQSKIKLNVNSIIGSYFIFSNNKYLEKGMIGKLTHYGEHTYQQLCNLTELVRLFNKQDQYLNEKSDLTLYFSETVTEKQTEIVLEKGILNLQLKHLLKISLLFSLEGLETPPSPRIKPIDIPREVKQKVIKKSTITSIHANDLVVSTGDEQHQQIKILGQIHVVLVNKEQKTEQQAMRILRRDHDGQIPFGNFTIDITNLQLFLTYKPKQGLPRKRTLLNPVTITIQGSNSYTITNDNKLCITNKYQIRINSLIIQATISDSVRFQRIIDINKQIIADFNAVSEAKRQKQLNKPEVQLVEQIIAPETSRPLDKTLVTRVDFGDTEILIINDANGMFVPIIKLSIHSIKPSSYIVPSKTQLLLTTVLEASFFNPKNARWEPVLQKSTISLKSESKTNQSHTQSVLQLIADENINFNLSSQLLISLLVSMKFAKDVGEMLNNKEENHSVLLEENGLQLPSPYALENVTNTTFKIILTQNSLKKLQLDNRLEAKEYIEKHRETVVPPGFEGYIFIPSEADQIDLEIEGETYTVKLNRFLKHRIGDTRFLFTCKVDKLTRVIKIVSETSLTNLLEVPVLIHYGGNTIKLGAGKRIPLEKVSEFQISRNRGFKSEKIFIENLEETNIVKCPNTSQFLLISNKSYDVNGLLYRPLFIKPPLKLINCLPKPFLFQLYRHNEENASRLVQSQEEYQLFSYSDAEDLLFKFYIPGFHWCKPVILKENINKEIDVTFRDVDLDFTVVRLLIVKNQDFHNLQLHIYSPAYIINDTPFDLCFLTSPSSQNKKKQKHFKMVAGQKRVHRLENLDDTIILLGADAGNELKLTDKKDDTSALSNPVGIIGMSEVQVEVIKQFKGQQQIFFVTLSMEIDLKQMHKNSDVLSKQVRFKTKYIIYNVACRIHWKQVDTKQWFTLQTNEKEIFYLLNKQQWPQIIVKTDTSSESAYLEASLLGQIYFAVEQKGKPFYMKIDNRAANGHVIMQITEVKEEDLPYQLHNKLNDNIVIRMLGFNKDVFPGQKASFVWSDPSDERKLAITVLKDNEALCTLEVNPDEAAYTNQFKVDKQGKQVTLKIFVRVENDKRIITIDEEQDVEERQIKLSTTKILFKQLGVSLIMNHQGLEQSYQAFFLSLKNLEFFYQKTNYHDITQLRVKFLQIDQNSPQFIKHPVMLTPQRFNYFNNVEDDHFINLLLKRDIRSQKQTIIEQVLIDIKDLAIRMSDESIQMILSIRSEVVKIMDPKKEEFKFERKRDEWKSNIEAKRTHKVFVEHIAVSPLIVKLTASTSFGTGSEKVNKQQELMGRFFTAFGVAFANIQQALLVFRGIDLDNIFDTPQGIQQKLLTHYKTTALSEIYKVFGSLTVLGDPRGLFLNISTGLRDMVSKPVQGLVRGPLELGKGIASGASSLYSHVMGGVLGSATKMIRSLSTGLNVLTFDQKYIHDNLVIQADKTRGFFNGMKKGFRILFFAFKDSILGLVIKPIRGFQRQSILGFIIGGMTAVAGIVIKPVAGILDFIWITLDSIKNTIVFHQDSANEFRIRQPRVFYGPNSAIHQYSLLDANSLLVLRQKNALHNQLIIDTFQLDEFTALIILSDELVVVNPKKHKIEWSISIKSIGSVVKTHRGVEIKSKVVGNQKQNIYLLDTTAGQRELKEEIREAIDAVITDAKQDN